MANPSSAWRLDHPWAPVYAFSLNHPPVSIAGGALLFQTDMRLLYRALEEIGEMPDGSTILDVPCGGGVALRGLRPEQGVRYVASDISAAMLARTEAEAARRGLETQVETREADAGALPFADGEFDLVVSLTGLHCFPDPRTAVIEIGRVCKDGGRAIGSWFVSDPSPLHLPHKLLGRLSGLLGPSATEQEVRAWLQLAGFARVGIKRSGPLAYFTAQ